MSTATAIGIEAWVAAFDRNWRAGGPARDFVERFTPLLHPDVRLVQPQIPTLVGLEAFEKGFAEPLFALMPDAAGRMRDWAARDDVLYIEVEVSGTVGGRPASLRSCDRITLRDGRATERVAYVDPLEFVRAVALSPRSWPTFVRTQIDQRRR